MAKMGENDKMAAFQFMMTTSKIHGNVVENSSNSSESSNAANSFIFSAIFCQAEERILFVISLSLTNKMTRYSVEITCTRLTLCLALWKYSVYVYV